MVDLPHPLEALPVDGKPLDVLRPLMDAAAEYQEGRVRGEQWEALQKQIVLYVLRMRDLGFKGS